GRKIVWIGEAPGSQDATRRRGGTPPAVATGRELSGRRTTEQYLCILACLLGLHGAVGIQSRLSWAGRAFRPATRRVPGIPVPSVMRARCRRGRAPRSCRQLFGDTRGEQLTILIQEKAQESEGQQQLANRSASARVTPDNA